jgi:hypothetical protein
LSSHETHCLRSLSRKCGFKKGSDTLEIQCCGRVETTDAGKQCRKCSTLCCEDCFSECLGPPLWNGKRPCGKGWCSSCSRENLEEEERCCYDCLELASDSEMDEEDSDYGVGGDDSESDSDDHLGAGDSGQESGEDESVSQPGKNRQGGVEQE